MKDEEKMNGTIKFEHTEIDKPKVTDVERMLVISAIIKDYYEFGSGQDFDSAEMKAGYLSGLLDAIYSIVVAE